MKVCIRLPQGSIFNCINNLNEDISWSIFMDIVNCTYILQLEQSDI